MADSFANSCREEILADAESEEPRQRVVLDLVHINGDWSVLEPLAPLPLRIASAIAQYVECPAASEATLALSSDAHVQALNKAYRGKDFPTNVLSFPPSHSLMPYNQQTTSLGDIVLAFETMTQEAEAAGKPALHHFQHLVVHGVLHLLGYDHETEAEADEMEGLEARILADLGIANPYHEPAAPKPS